MFSQEGNGKYIGQSRTGFLKGEREKEQSEYLFLFLPSGQEFTKETWGLESKGKCFTHRSSKFSNPIKPIA